jgi:ketosteroid isomerase-like protein
VLSAALRDRVHANFEAFFSGDLDGAVEIMAPDVVAYDAPEMPDTGVLHGREELRERLAGFLELFDQVAMRNLQIEELHGYVLAVVDVSGKARITELPLEQTIAYLLRIADEQVVEMRVFFDPAAARDFAAA